MAAKPGYPMAWWAGVYQKKDVVRAEDIGVIFIEPDNLVNHPNLA